VIAQPYRQHRHEEFLRFLKLIDDAVPGDLALHLICDKYATRKTRGPQVAAALPPLPAPLHPYQRLLAQRRRAPS
jgi:hypothetical protein